MIHDQTDDGWDHRGVTGTTDRVERIHRVADAITQSRLEGTEPSPEFTADAALWIDGEIDDREFMDRGLRRWRLPTSPSTL